MTGSVFSVSIYFGGAIVCGGLFGAWFASGIVIGAVAGGWLLLRVIRTARSRPCEDGQTRPHSHLLLAWLESQLSKREFGTFLLVVTVVYFFLFVEELALGRLLLNTFFPNIPPLAGVSMATLFVVVYVYVRFGGYKAVLNSDFVQVAVLIVFLSFLFYLSLTSQPGESRVAPLMTIQPSITLLTISVVPLTALFVAGWLVSSLDIYARLNFSVRSDLRGAADKRFVITSLLLLVAIMFSGIFFGQFLVFFNAFPSDLETVAYARYITSFILQHGSLIGSVALIVALFCALFTTLDTILITLMQLEFYRHDKKYIEQRFAALILMGVLVAAAIDFRHLVAGWFFTISCFIPLAYVVLQSTGRRFKFRINVSNYLPSWVVVAAIGYGFIHVHMTSHHTHHFLIPLVVVLAGLIVLPIAGYLTRRAQ